MVNGDDHNTAWSLGSEYFRRMYATDDDPWGFDDRWYERRKYALTLALLPRRRYRCVFEPGCANGSLTALLQERGDHLIACELVPEAAHRARSRLAAYDHVEVHHAAFPDWRPRSEFDLLVLSEMAYYLTAAGRRQAEQVITDLLAPDGDIVAVHYTGETDYPMAGSDVAVWLDGLVDLTPTVRLVDEQFEAGVWHRRPVEPAEMAADDESVDKAGG